MNIDEDGVLTDWLAPRFLSQLISQEVFAGEKLEDCYT